MPGWSPDELRPRHSEYLHQATLFPVPMERFEVETQVNAEETRRWCEAGWLSFDPCSLCECDRKHGSLHVKCATADGHMLLVSSANLTEYAMTLNMELGVLVKDGPLPPNVESHFDRLIQQGDLAPCCPRYQASDR